jgi:hypothetical protein
VALECRLVPTATRTKTTVGSPDLPPGDKRAATLAIWATPPFSPLQHAADTPRALPTRLTTGQTHESSPQPPAPNWFAQPLAQTPPTCPARFARNSPPPPAFPPRTAWPCCGTWPRASVSTPWTPATSSTPSCSAPTATGCAPRRRRPSRRADGGARARVAVLALFLGGSSLRCAGRLGWSPFPKPNCPTFNPFRTRHPPTHPPTHFHPSNQPTKPHLPPNQPPKRADLGPRVQVCRGRPAPRVQQELRQEGHHPLLRLPRLERRRVHPLRRCGAGAGRGLRGGRGRVLGAARRPRARLLKPPPTSPTLKTHPRPFRNAQTTLVFDRVHRWRDPRVCGLPRDVRRRDPANQKCRVFGLWALFWV